MSTAITEKSARDDSRAGGARPTRVRRAILLLVVCVAISALARIGLGAAGALVLGSTWLLAAGIGRALPGLRGPASWAAAVAVEFAIVLGLSVILAFLSPHPHDRSTYLAIVVLPGAVGGILWLASGRLRRARVGARLPSRWGIALPITIGGLMVAALIASRGPFFGVAWAMSGGARNHVEIIRELLSGGGLTVGALKAYPAGVNAFAAVLAGAGDRTGGAGQTILNDVNAIATTYVLAGISIAVLLAGALLEILPRAIRYGRRLPAPIGATALIASLAAGSPFVLGMALTPFDGYFSAYGALPFALAAVVFALRFQEDDDTGVVILVLLSGTVLLTFVSWPILVVVPGCLLLVVSSMAAVSLAKAHRRGGPARNRAGAAIWWVAVAGAFSTLVVVAAVVAVMGPRLAQAFVVPGPARIPYTYMLVVICLVGVGVAASSGGRVRRQMLLPVAVCVAGALTLLWLVRLPGAGGTWTYYALKTNWLVCASLFWVPFTPVVLWFGRERKQTGSRARERGRSLSALCSAMAVLLMIGSATTAPGVLVSALHGWTQPSAPVVAQAIAGADDGEEFVFWDWSDPGNDRMGNFWSALVTQMPGVSGGLRYWSYTYTGQISDLCTLARGAPGITVFTHSESLRTDLRKSCPAGVATVSVG